MDDVALCDECSKTWRAFALPAGITYAASYCVHHHRAAWIILDAGEPVLKRTITVVDAEIFWRAVEQAVASASAKITAAMITPRDRVLN